MRAGRFVLFVGLVWLFSSPSFGQERLNGVEFNPLFLLCSVARCDDQTVFSGSLSRFFPDRKLELLTPIFFQRLEGKQDAIVSLAVRRYFPGQGRGLFPDRQEMAAAGWLRLLKGMLVPTRQPGVRPYLGVSLRYFHSSGDGITTANRLGLAGSLGFRWFSSRRLYLGMDLTMGRYLLGDTDRPAAVDRFIVPPLDSKDIAVDLTFFQLGWRF